MPRRIAVLGSTGSIGENTLRVIAAHPERFQIVALAAGRNWHRLAEQARRFRPAIVSVSDRADVDRLAGHVPAGTAVVCGEAGLREAAAGADAEVVVSALVGAAGLSPTLAAVEAGASIALANKEVLVMAGELVTSSAKKHGAALLPVDSEHAGVFQALADRPGAEVRRVILTASGGPFRTRPVAELADVTPEEALKHPNWMMGPKITVDSASMMNKGLEIIEARWLFDLEGDRVGVLIHPQSIVHAMVEFVDGSVLAQMSVPDMRISIAQAIGYPDRIPIGVEQLDLARIGSLTFEEPDPSRFPCLTHAQAALREGGTAPAVLNAVNEVAVASFLAGGAKFSDIPEVVGAALDAHKPMPADGLEPILEADRWAREFAACRLDGKSAKVRL